MADAGDLTVMQQGRVCIPEDIRRRWGTQDGDRLAYIDLGEAVLILPGGYEWVRRTLIECVDDAGQQSTRRAASDETRGWPPDSGASFRLDVHGDTWEVSWGRHDEFGTAAFWVDKTITDGYADNYPTMDLLTATVWGLLHGGPIKAESGEAFLEPVMDLLRREPTPTAEVIEVVLRTRIEGIGGYRFPERAAGFIAAAVDRLRREPPPDDPALLRRYLLDLRGVGPKTAALIVSGATGGNAEVHVNDIWLRRALTSAGVFRRHWQVEHDYDRFEEAFLQYARHAGVMPGALDWCIWELAREGNSTGDP